MRTDAFRRTVEKKLGRLDRETAERATAAALRASRL
jgi:hypothetical protein